MKYGGAGHYVTYTGAERILSVSLSRVGFFRLPVHAWPGRQCSDKFTTAAAAATGLCLINGSRWRRAVRRDRLNHLSINSVKLLGEGAVGRLVQPHRCMARRRRRLSYKMLQLALSLVVF